MPGALWQLAWLDRDRVNKAPDLKRIVVAIDPAVSDNEGSDETEIIVAGVGGDREDYVLEALSGRYAPHEWAAKAIEAYRRHKADRIIAETSNGGAMVEATIRAPDPRVSFKSVHASRGKGSEQSRSRLYTSSERCITSAFFRRLKIRCVPLPVTSTVAATAIRRIASTRSCGH